MSVITTELSNIYAVVAPDGNIRSSISNAYAIVSVSGNIKTSISDAYVVVGILKAFNISTHEAKSVATLQATHDEVPKAHGSLTILLNEPSATGGSVVKLNDILVHDAPLSITTNQFSTAVGDYSVSFGGSGLYVFVFFDNMLIVWRGNDFAVLPMKYISIPHTSCTATVQQGSATVVFPEMGDAFGATYIEVNNTALGGIASILAKRGVTMIPGGKYYVMAKNGRATHSTSDALYWTSNAGTAIPTRGVVIGSEVIPFDAGGDTIGTILLNIATNGLAGRYGKAMLSRMKATARTTAPLISEIGDIITVSAQWQGDSTTIGGSIEVLETEVNFRSGDVSKSVRGVQQ